MAQIKVIRKARQELHTYIARKTSEMRELKQPIGALALYNHRQAGLIRHALKHPDQVYTFKSHQSSHIIAYQTARTDLMQLADGGFFAGNVVIKPSS